LDWTKERRKRNKFTAAQWAEALRGAGDYAGYPFSLGDNPAVSFIDDLTHTGDYAGKPFRLELWQEAFLRLVFDEEGRTRYRYVFFGLPRKNGKTELVGAIVVYLLLGTGIHGQRVYSASGDAEQAGLVHFAASSMIAQNETMSDVAQVYKGNLKRIVVDPIGAEYKALSSEAYSKFGLRPNVNIYDELHVFPNAELHTALETAFGATKRPCSIYITTAGWDRTSLCYQLWQRARDAQRDPQSDPEFLAVLYEFREGDDWTDEKVWQRINPGLGSFREVSELRSAVKNAQRFPAQENAVRQYYLNQWTQQALRWISVEAWDACGVVGFSGTDMAGLSCYGGLDLGVTGDMSCVSLVFPTSQGIRCLVHGWVPEQGKWRDELRNKDRYLAWEREGYLTFTEGNVRDGNQIIRDIVRWNAKFPFYMIFADRAYANDILIALANDHQIPVKGIPQGEITLNEACVKLEEMVLSGTIEHGNNPVLNWNVANCSLKRGHTGLVCPDKTIATERIDGLAALVNAIAAMVADPEDRSPSIYESGPFIL
jgi:phage terminase large subunit-like protein